MSLISYPISGDIWETHGWGLRALLDEAAKSLTHEADLFKLEEAESVKALMLELMESEQAARIVDALLVAAPTVRAQIEHDSDADSRMREYSKSLDVLAQKLSEERRRL